MQVAASDSRTAAFDISRRLRLNEHALQAIQDANTSATDLVALRIWRTEEQLQGALRFGVATGRPTATA